MANNTELITGRGEDAHVSSFDMRAFNRAVFGTGKYIFTDAENMSFEVDTVSKMFTIKSGSCMWSGMHIRIEDEQVVSFVSPATTSDVYLWLHYKRNASTQVESVEFVSTTSSRINSSLIYDELPDDVAEAYTLFATIEYDAANSVVRTTTNEFELVKGMSDFFKETTQRLTAQSAEISGKFAELETNLNTTFENYKDTIMDTTYEKTILFDGNLSTSGKDYPLSDDFYAYRVIVIQIGGFQHVWYRPTVWNIHNDIIVPLIVSLGSDSITVGQLALNCKYDTLNIRYNQTKVYRDSLGTFFEQSSSFSGDVKIYGLGKD